ncbi:MAG: Peptidoglycan-binding LysM [Chthoniobacteraceae bacterium]|nr:Peptidoglycan-binding LysM [Chthoniobacteraceae bacterium]
MIRKLAIPLVFLASHLSSSAASSRPDIAVEYDQVRRIALRDVKVQKAFDRANRQLEEKIVELDPALADYRPSRHEEAPRETRAAHPEPFRPAPVTRVTPKTTARPAPRIAAPARRNHTLEKGETLGSVAGKYRVTVQELRVANRIRDDRKLSVGQVLIIPSAQ